MTVTYLCFHILSIVNTDTINTGVRVSLWYADFTSFLYILRSRLTASYSTYILSFLMNLYILFQNGCINLYSHQQCLRIPFSCQVPVAHTCNPSYLEAVNPGKYFTRPFLEYIQCKKKRAGEVAQAFFSSSVKNIINIFIGIELSLYITLDSMDILPILILVTQN
jgi:hypothetical protein